MNEEQLKKDKELLSSWKEKLVYDAPGSCSFCMSEDDGVDDIVTLEDCEELLEAQKRVTEAEVREKIKFEQNKPPHDVKEFYCECLCHVMSGSYDCEHCKEVLCLNPEQDD